MKYLYVCKKYLFLIGHRSLAKIISFRGTYLKQFFFE